GRTPESQKPLSGDDAIFLSDLASDPGETTNLRHKHPEIVDGMQSMLNRWLSGMQPPSE
ncbi:MAG: hypothetical protein IT167_06485, partial [Bryobacterales bacterium]|nr:hypothetical protein [Bryobacterales bacterium]